MKLVSFVALVLMFCFADNFSPFQPGHECPFEHCPYKGVPEADWKEAVNEYSECEEGTDCYIVDILHLQYPKCDYDVLEVMIFTEIKTVSDYKNYLIGIGYSEIWADVKSKCEFGLRVKDSIYNAIIED